jgi:hypothetical protein
MASSDALEASNWPRVRSQKDLAEVLGWKNRRR